MKSHESQGPQRTLACAMTQTFDDRYEYGGFWGCTSWCRLEIWEAAGRPPVVIVTNPAGDNGTTVTNFAEPLAALVCRQFGLETRSLVWIECYEWTPADYRYGAYEVSRRTNRRSFDRVFFEIDPEGRLYDAEWVRFGLQAAEALIGHPL